MFNTRIASRGRALTAAALAAAAFMAQSALGDDYTDKFIKAKVTAPLAGGWSGGIWAGNSFFSPYVRGTIGATTYATTYGGNANFGLKYSGGTVTRSCAWAPTAGPEAGGVLATSVSVTDTSATVGILSRAFTMAGTVGATASTTGLAATAFGGMSDPIQFEAGSLSAAQHIDVVLAAGTQMQVYKGAGTPGVQSAGKFARAYVLNPSDMWEAPASDPNDKGFFNVSVADTGSGFSVNASYPGLPSGFGYGISFDSSPGSVISALSNPSNWQLSSSGNAWTLRNDVVVASYDVQTLDSTRVGDSVSVGTLVETGTMTPAPSSLALLGAAGLVSYRRRRGR